MKIDKLINISGLLTLNKIAEKCIAELMLKDMKAKLDVSQYSNQKGIGIQHFLVNMIDRIQAHVPSDIPTHNGYIERAHLKSQENLSLINSWTKKKKMILNMKKTKNMIFKYTKNH